MQRHSVWQVVVGAVIAGLGWVAALDAGEKEAAPLALDGSAAAVPWARYSAWPAANYDKFNTLTQMKSPAAAKAQAIGTAIEGDPVNGQKLAVDRSRGGSCIACHVMGPNTPELPGNVGPDLSTIGSFRNDEWLYNYIVDARAYNPNSIMPPWGTNGLFSDKEIRDLVAYMKTLKTPALFSNPLDDPAQRPRRAETRDNLDPFENPGMDAVDKGRAKFAAQGPNGKACVSCHAAPDQAFRQWAATMPRYESRLKKVVNVEEFVARHAAATTGASLLMETPDNIALSVFLRHLANGTPIAVDVASADAIAAAARGKELMARKIGQLNFACNDCHQIGKERWIRGQWLGEFRGQTPHFPTWRTSQGDIWDLRKRMQWCNVAVRANELPPDAAEYGDIELYLMSVNNGLALSVPGIRH